VSGFTDTCTAWAEKAKRRLRLVAEGSVRAARDSIVDGSALTGAPGQPDRSGELVESWIEEIGPTSGRVVTEEPYAPVIEAGVERGSPIVYASGGGAHSVKLTIAAFPRIVQDQVQQARASG
jgi:hypothetical protein